MRVLSVYKVWVVPLVLINTNTRVEREWRMPCRRPGSFVFLLRSADRHSSGTMVNAEKFYLTADLCIVSAGDFFPHKPGSVLYNMLLSSVRGVFQV